MDALCYIVPVMNRNVQFECDGTKEDFDRVIEESPYKYKGHKLLIANDHNGEACGFIILKKAMSADVEVEVGRKLNEDIASLPLDFLADCTNIEEATLRCVLNGWHTKEEQNHSVKNLVTATCGMAELREKALKVLGEDYFVDKRLKDYPSAVLDCGYTILQIF